LQNTFKFSSTVLWYLGFAQGNFADFDAAARVTQIGRDLLKKMIDWLSAHGAQVIEVDTDGIYFVPPPVAAGVPPAKNYGQRSRHGCHYSRDIGQLQTGLAKELPPGIESRVRRAIRSHVQLQRRITRFLTRDGDVIIKEARSNRADSKSSSAFFLEEMIKLLMEGKPEEIVDLREKFENKIRNANGISKC